MNETGGKRHNNLILPPEEKRFSSEHQPSGKAKSNGWKRKKFKRELLQEMLDLKYTFPANSKVRQQLVDAFGDGVLKLTLGQIMSLQQAQKAILQGDSSAYTTIMNQLYGQPQQNITFDDGTTVKVGYGEKDDQV